jgi:uncharacterized membrane protein
MTEAGKSKITWAYHIINAGLLLFMAVFAFYSWGRLPDRVPVHSSINGEPNRWTQKGDEMVHGSPMLHLRLSHGLLS